MEGPTHHCLNYNDPYKEYIQNFMYDGHLNYNERIPRINMTTM